MGFVVLILFAAIWTIPWFVPGGPEGPVYRFGLESNAAAFIPNTVALIIFAIVISKPMIALMQKEEAARKELDLNGRLKWFGYTYVRCLLIIGSFSGVYGLYLNGTSSGFPYNIENKLIHWALNSAFTAMFVTPLFMWLDTREKRQKSVISSPGFFERLGYRIGRYIYSKK